jgi:hypothetical protein
LWVSIGKERFMRKYLSGGVIVTLLATFVLVPGLFAEDGEPAPSIIIETMRFNFGEVFEQETYRHVFKVKNEGTADLVIEKVKPG